MVSAGVLPAVSDVMYAAMPGEEMLCPNQLGVPYTMKLAVCVLPDLVVKLALMVALVPIAFAALNQLLGTFAEYRRVHLAPLGPRCEFEVMVKEEAPGRLALMLSDGFDTSELPCSS
jgi:hypothetical protein